MTRGAVLPIRVTVNLKLKLSLLLKSATAIYP